MTLYPAHVSIRPSGTLLERLVWAALIHRTASYGRTYWRDLAQETGCTLQEILEAVDSLVARGIVEHTWDEGHEFRLTPEYRPKFPPHYRRMLFNADFMGTSIPFSLQEDIDALYNFNRDIPETSVLAYVAQILPDCLTDEAHDRVARAHAAKSGEDKHDPSHPWFDLENAVTGMVM